MWRSFPARVRGVVLREGGESCVLRMAAALAASCALLLPAVLLHADEPAGESVEAAEIETTPGMLETASSDDGPASTPETELIARGAYLVTIADCNGCHTPLTMTPEGPRPDMSRMLSGHPQDMAMPATAPDDGPWNIRMAATATAFAGPWGVSYAPNLTPDIQTGLGTWTREMFVSALRTGRHMGVSRPIMPPMPWTAYGQMTDEDLAAVFAYLRSVPPIRNQAPASVEAAADTAGSAYSE